MTDRQQFLLALWTATLDRAGALAVVVHLILQSILRH